MCETLLELGEMRAGIGGSTGSREDWEMRNIVNLTNLP